MPKRTKIRLYSVTFRVKYPAWNERDECVWHVMGWDRSDAASTVRRKWSDLGNDSPLIIVSSKLAAEDTDPTDFSY